MRRQPVVGVCVIGSILLSLGAASAGELRGRLVVGDKPASGVGVEALPYEAPLDLARREARHLPAPAPLATTATKPDGSFVLSVPVDPGKEALVTVRVEGEGVVPAVFDGMWGAGERDDLGEHVLLPGARLSGKVTDATGKPVGDAEVTLLTEPDRTEQADLDPAPRTLTTAADGAFHFDDAGATGNTLRIEKAGLLAARFANVGSGALARPVVLEPGVTVTGVVRGTDGTSPAAGALVRVEGRVATGWVEAKDDGTFTLPDAPPGSVRVIADGGDAGYVEQHQVWLPLATGSALSLVLRPPATVAGRTVDAKTSRPVPRVAVELREGGEVRRVRSGPDGAYSLADVPPGAWQVRADEPRYVRWTRADLLVRAGETTRLDIPLVLGAVLSGRVSDEQGKPIAGAAGSLIQSKTTRFARFRLLMGAPRPPAFRSLPDGTFKATRLMPGAGQVLTVARAEYESATVGGITLAPGAVKAGVNVVLKRGGVVAGVVKDADGNPIAGAEAELSQEMSFRGGRGAMRANLTLAGPGAERKAATSGADGTFAIHGVASGEYALIVTRTGYATGRVDPVKVPESGSPAPVEVKLGPGAAICGRVTTKAGTGVEGYFVIASPPGGPLAGRRGGGSSRQRTDADGEFSIDGLTPGQAYDLRLFGPTGPANGKSSVVAPASALQLVVPGKGRIAGRALDAASGEPITDFSVGYGPDTGGRGGPRILFRVVGESADSTGQAVPVHSDDGAFALDDVPAGTWRVTVSAEGYQTAHTAGVVVDEGATRSGVEVRLSKGATLKGRVLDATNGAPVANATVSLASSGGRSGPPALAGESNAGDATTDAGGEFELDGVATGRQTLHVSHPDYTDATQTVEIKDEGTTVEVRMTPGSAIGGVVLSDANQPVPEATVSLGQEGAAGFGFRGGGGGQSTVSDSSGQFSFDHLGAGRYSLEASLGSHTSSPVDVVVVAGQPQASVTLQLQLGVMIQGTVSGLPETSIAGTSVSANGADSYFQTTRVAAAGQFEFDNVPVGIVTLRATATDPSGSTRSVTKQVTATSDQPVMTADLVFDQGYTLSGSVTQAGQAVSGAMVFAALQGGGGRQASASSDDSGAYSLTGLQAGTYTVGAMSPTLGAATRQTIALSADQTLDIIFPDAKITGQVVDAQSKAPLASATVGIAAQDPDATPAFGQRMATADSNGQFSFSGLSEGGYTLTTSKPDYQIDTHSVSASESGDEAVTIELTRAAGIAVKVLDGLAGVPLSGAMVRVLDGSGAGAFGPAPITLDSSGGGEIPSLPPGAYTVIADSSGYAPTRLDGVNVPSATVVIPLTPGGAVLFQAGPRALAGGTATGTITTTAGAPALLSLFNVQGRFAISEANLQLRNVPPGGYVLTVPAIDFSQPFTVTEGGTTTVQLP